MFRERDRDGERAIGRGATVWGPSVQCTGTIARGHYSLRLLSYRAGCTRESPPPPRMHAQGSAQHSRGSVLRGGGALRQPAGVLGGVPRSSGGAALLRPTSCDLKAHILVLI